MKANANINQTRRSMKTQIPIFGLDHVEPINTKATLTRQLRRQPAMSNIVYLLQGALRNDCAASDVTFGISSQVSRSDVT
jgi:hypothetical protein